MIRRGRESITGRAAALLPAAALSVFSAACFSSVALVKVRPDGSGIVEVTATIRKAALAQLNEIAGDPALRRPQTADEWLPGSAAARAAADMGAHVRLVSTRAIEDRAVIGRVATYAFDDVRRLTLELIPIIPDEGGHGSTARLVGTTHFTFDIAGEPERRMLLARFPDAQIEYSGADTDTPDAPYDPQQEALLRAFVGGGRLEVAVEPELPILRTNTPHHAGQRVTLLAIDAERVMLDGDTWKRLRLRPASLDELRFQLHDAPGVTVGLDREIRIELASR